MDTKIDTQIQDAYYCEYLSHDGLCKKADLPCPIYQRLKEELSSKTEDINGSVQGTDSNQKAHAPTQEELEDFWYDR